MNELKPCPFCGGEAQILVQTMFDDVFFGAKCNNCGAEAAAKNTEAEAIAAWNTRAEQTCRIVEYDEAPFPVCSECGAVQPDDYTVYYCWNCGAKVVIE